MRIFISYASEYRALAEALTTELRPLGHRVFLDRQDLAPGETYTDQIRGSIRQSDLLVFLITPEAVKPGRYTMTELHVMQEIAPSPGRRVLPVMATPTPLKDIPDYLSSVTILTPKGDLVTETLHAIEGLQVRASRERMWRAGALTALAFGLVGLASLLSFWFPSRVTTSALRDPFSVYGTNFVAPGDTAVIRLTNKRPDLLPDFSCRVDAAALGDNITSIDHDRKCETITIRMKRQPFVKADGTAIEQVSYDRLPVAIDAAAVSGEIIWRGKWDVGLRNFIERRRFSVRTVESGGRGASQLEVLLDNKALGAGYECRVHSGGIARVDSEEGACILARTGSPPTVGTVTIRHPKSGWSQDYTLEPIF